MFYYLSAFSNTGGIEKFNRCFIKALNDLSETDEIVPAIVSAYDSDCDEHYTRKRFFKGFAKRRGKSVRHVVRESLHSDVLILGHINLAVAGVIAKLISPKTKLFIVAHGIDVWKQQRFLKKLALKWADRILSVSSYTKNQLVLRNNIQPEKIRLFPNTIDPYFALPHSFEKPLYLLKRYGLTGNQPVIFTLSRLVSTEQYKGYDMVMASMPHILRQFPQAVYILAGRYDDAEKERIYKYIAKYNLAGRVILTGFVADEEVTDHYRLADVFVMPSQKEGFGIVFLEAMLCGLPVIAGNLDGSVDALRNGELGLLIDPTKVEAIGDGIATVLQSLPYRQPQDAIAIQQKVIAYFGFKQYKNRLLALFNGNAEAAFAGKVEATAAEV